MQVRIEKKRIVEDKKIYMKIQIKKSICNYPEKLELNQLWNEALDYAGSKTDSLPVSKKLNGFYLQELMHRYVELLGNVVTENKEN